MERELLQRRLGVLVFVGRRLFALSTASAQLMHCIYTDLSLIFVRCPKFGHYGSIQQLFILFGIFVHFCNY